jgi:hypothetical protein
MNKNKNMEKFKVIEWKHGFGKVKDNFGVKITTPNNGVTTIAVNYELFFYFLKENKKTLHDDSEFDNFKDYFDFLNHKNYVNITQYLQEYIDENVSEKNIKQLIDFI